ncbi:ATP-binding protein [Fructobacillus fructosus]|uniref:Contains AAA domain (YhaN) n=1 Tax=Fructobacillus fructosus TaxID=1631 RepID=A0ABN9YQP7_9LACO|nr:AAA family ATPase [Fructobacillus fructosus]MBC9118921.1 AAA family ATPase [Fructobacillus fructosus]MBD9365585.1 AAA family ATPase [Leuconostoc mesenteroides]CAK1237040.1 Uncharacterized conserved protein YhaN [Fructobacillus fructosus]
MKIEEIHIVGFGKWTDVTFRFSNDFQIIAGPNEAGKTSLKAFIIGVFFGFPRGRRADQQLYEPRSGARYGGRVTIATQKGRFTIERLDRTQSMLTVRSLDSGLTMPDPEKWLQRLFAPLTEKDYRHIFSFDEAELDQVTNLTGDDFEQALLTYAKPQTQQFLSWADQHHQLGQQQFAQGKNGKRPLNMANKAYRALQEKQALASQQEGQYQNLLAKRLELEATLAQLTDEETKLQEALHDKQSELADWSLYQDVSTKKNASKELVELPDENRRQAIQELEQEKRWLEKKAQEQQEALTSIQQELSDQNQVPPSESVIRDTMASLAAYQSEEERIVQAIAHAGHGFTRGLPQPLNQTEEKLLQKSARLPWTVAFLLLGASLLAALLLPGLEAGLLLVVSLALLGFFWQQKSKKRALLDRFAPLNQAAILAYQDRLRTIYREQSQLPLIDKQRQQALQALKKALLQSGRLDEATLAAWSDDQVQDWVKEELLDCRHTGKTGLNHRLQEALRQQAAIAKQKEQLAERLQEQLAPYGLANIDDFYERINQQQKQEQLLVAQRMATKQLGQGRLATFSKLVDTLGQENVANHLQAQLGEYQNKLASLRQSKNQQQQLIADVSAQLTQLVEKGSLTSISQELANFESDLKEDYVHYLAQVLAVDVVKRAFVGKEDSLAYQVFEQAGAYLAQLTEGAYQRILLNDGSINVFDSAGQLFRAIELSSGTRDLLFLAIRLALSTSVHREEPLPLLIDDALVHLDHQRRQAALVLLQELATEQQVLFWTFDEGLLGPSGIRLT